MGRNKIDNSLKPHAIMIAFPFQGHINPFVHLALKLATQGFSITFVHTEYAHHLISKSKTNYKNDHDFFLEARNSGLDITYTTISDGYTLEFDRDANWFEFWESMLGEFWSIVDRFIGTIIESSDHDPMVVPFLVTDTVYSWPAKIANKYNLVNVSFWTQPATAFSINYFVDLLRENGHFPPSDNECHTIIDYIPGVESISSKDLMSHLQEKETLPIVHRMMFDAFEAVRNADFILCNTVQELEPNTVAVLNQQHPTYAIGPVNFFQQGNVYQTLVSETDCTQWLDSKPNSSVLYVSFGSVVQTNKQVIEEVAHGLILSEVSFIWVVRAGIVSSDDGDVLPVGFIDLVKDRGLIVPWCNQNVVLCNPAVGGFITHCGWNSILESSWHGVPMICYPVTYDQPTNRKLIVDDWKIGINLCDAPSVTREEVADKIKRLMIGETSVAIKQEMEKIRSIMHNALEDENGSSVKNFDRFIEDLKQSVSSKRGHS